MRKTKRREVGEMAAHHGEVCAHCNVIIKHSNHSACADAPCGVGVIIGVCASPQAVKWGQLDDFVQC